MKSFWRGNAWRISTLLLAGALVAVVGRGAITPADACDSEVSVPSTEQETRLRLARALALLERADQEVAAATAARPKERSDALVQIAKARASLELALAPLPAPSPKPKPLPRKTTAEVAEPFATPPPQASPQRGQDLIDPFLRVSTDKRPLPVKDARVLDPWDRSKNR